MRVSHDANLLFPFNSCSLLFKRLASACIDSSSCMNLLTGLSTCFVRASSPLPSPPLFPNCSAATKWKQLFARHSSSQTSHPTLSTPATDLDSTIHIFRTDLEHLEAGFSARLGVIKNEALLLLDTLERDEDSGYESAEGGGVTGEMLGKGVEQIKQALKSAEEALVGGGPESAAEKVKEEEEVKAAENRIKAAFDWFAHGSL